MTATLDDILAFITPKRVIVAAPYSHGQHVLFLHLAGQPRSSGWVLPTERDCKAMKLNPTQYEGYRLARVDDDFEADLPAQYDRVNWWCCDFALDCPIDPDTRAAIAEFNRTSRLDKFLAYADSLHQPKRNSQVHLDSRKTQTTSY